MGIKIALSSYENKSTNICPDRDPSGLEYADDVVSPTEAARFLGRLKYVIGLLGICFLSSDCKVVLQNWTGSKLNLFSGRRATGWGG